MTLNGVTAVTLCYFIEFCKPVFHLHNRVNLWRNLFMSVLHFVLRVRCCRIESSRSLSHLLMSFLFYLEAQYNSQCQPTVVTLSTVSSELQITVDLVSSE